MHFSVALVKKNQYGHCKMQYSVPNGAVNEQLVTGDRVRKLWLAWTWENTQYAKRHTDELWTQLSAEALSYKGRGTVRNGKDASEKLDYKVEVNELANMVDDTASLIEEQLTSGKLYEFLAEDTTQAPQVQTVEAVVDSHLRYKNFEKELHKLAHRFSKYKYAGLKTCRRTETKLVRKQEEIDTPTDDVLVMAGFDPSAEGVDAFLEMQGVRLRGGGNFESERPLTLLVESIDPEPRTRDTFYIEAINPRKLAFSDRNRTMERQFTVHEVFYMTRDELESEGSLRDIDKLGEPNATSTDGLPGSSHGDKTKSGEKIHPNFLQYETWQSWQQPPVARWLNEGKFSDEEWVKFCSDYDLDPNDLLQTPQLTCTWHTEDQALHKIFPNPKLEKTEFPIRIESYIPADDELIGGGFQERPSDFNDALHVVYNLWLDNLRKLLYQSYFVSARAEISKSDLDKVNKPKEWIRLKGNDDPANLIFPAPVQDATNAAQAGIQTFKSEMQDLGVAAVLQGKGKAGTATQDAINNQRGQTAINSAVSRIVANVVIPSVADVAGMVVANFTQPQVVETLGEDGTTIKHDVITPKQLTDKFRIVPVGSFSVADQQMKSQMIVSIANVFAPILMPQEMRALLELFLRYSRFSKSEIEKIMSLAGLDTDIKKEIRAMILSPDCDVEVRPEDQHAQAVAFAQAAAMMFPQLQAQENFQNYMMEHQAYLIQQQMQQQQMMAMSGKGPKGPPNQIPKEQPDDQQGMARRDAQFNSPVDTGVETSGGITGRASV